MASVERNCPVCFADGHKLPLVHNGTVNLGNNMLLQVAGEALETVLPAGSYFMRCSRCGYRAQFAGR